jgi:hypothetical protein
MNDAPTGTADAASDAASGTWTYKATSNHTTQGVAPASPNSVQVEVASGDLLVIMSDGNSPSSGQVSFSAMPSGIVTFAPAFEKDQGLPDGNGGTEPTTLAGTWGTVLPAAGTATMLTITVTDFTGWSDLSATLFSGGIAAPQQVDLVHTSGGTGGLATCGPIATVPNGAALYVAARWTCADAPVAGPFSQLGRLSGNPYGMYAPTDGTSATATLADCGNTGGWVCSTLSLSP